MASPSVIVSYPATPVDPATDHWLKTLQDDLALIEAEAYDESRSDHPGARHIVKALEDCAAVRRSQIAELRMRAEATNA